MSDAAAPGEAIAGVGEVASAATSTDAGAGAASAPGGPGGPGGPGELAELRAALGREKKKLELVREVGTALSSALAIEDLLALLMEKVTELMAADRSTMYLLTDDGQELWSKVVQGQAVLEIRLRVGEGIAGWVARSGEIVNIADAYADTRFQPAVDLRSGYRTRSILTVPMRNSLGAIVGVLQVLNKQGPDGAAAPFSAEDVELLLALASQAAVALDRKSVV